MIYWVTLVFVMTFTGAGYETGKMVEQQKAGMCVDTLYRIEEVLHPY